MDLGISFNPAELPEPEKRDFPVLPDDKYLVSIIESTVCDTDKTKYIQDSSQRDKFLKIVYSVNGTNYNGSRIWENINFKNQSAQCEQIGAAQLGNLMRACGLFGRPDSDLFVGKNLYIAVGVDKNGKNMVKSGGHFAVETCAPIPSSTPATGVTKPPFAFQKK